MGSAADLDRLIEEGLTLYGQGDLDGALLIWERVLAEDPQNEQANSYVDYVRMNYDMLTSDPGDDAGAPFGIADDNEPEYTIEISDGELPELPGRSGAGAPMYMDPADAGWMIEDERVGTRSDNGSERVVAATMDDLDDAPEISIEGGELEDPAEAEEPLANRAPTVNRMETETVRVRAGTVPGENFDDATREYEGPRKNTRDLSDEFGAEEGTGSFAQDQHTEYKKRDMGFVRAKEPPELKMTLRTPSDSAPPATNHYFPPTPPPPDRSAFELSYERAELDLPTGQHAPVQPVEPEDLIASLPSPKPAHITRDMPPLTKAPGAGSPPSTQPQADGRESDQASREETGEESHHESRSPNVHSRRTAVQKAIDLLDLDMPEPLDTPVTPTAPTRDLEQTPASISQHDPIISAPTRELGIRPGRVATEDEPTRTDQRILRAPPPDAEVDELSREGTRADYMLPFDPIDARAAQILEEIDANASSDEAKDDQTRRRISTLLERATLWTSVDLDRAVAAVDLALGEDPNSALAQKLIHRNRDAIMNVFQMFLGDLHRAPELARPLHELGNAPISPRAAFLLSRIDGTLTLDEILDVSGMPRLEAYRYLCQLFLRGILR